MADYRFIVSPETIKGDLFKVNYQGVEVGVYSAMTKVVSSGPNGSSLLTGLTVNVLLTQSAHDVGYYTPFDGAVLQKDVVSNFIFSATTGDPYTYYVYNTSNEFQKFLELSQYTLDWGDGSSIQIIDTFTPNNLSHTYPSSDSGYTITLKQTNPWGVTDVSKVVKTPFENVKIFNPKGVAFFTPKGGSWSATPISYDYIFSGDAVNVVSAQTSNNFTTVPFVVSGLTKSRINELKLYGTRPPVEPLFNPYFQIGTPVIANGQIWGSITNCDTGIFTAYTIQNVEYYDYADGTTIFFEQSSGFTDANLTAVPITKLESLLKVYDQPQIQTDVFIERGKNSAYERILRLGEVDNLGDLLNYGYGFFNVQNVD
jgi:hypothetical protein